jgi:predicted ATPase
MAKYVITGGPCVGKTTLCNELRRLGHHIIPEAARAIIDEEQLKENGILPWTDLYKFQNLIADRVEGLEEKVENGFCDRGILDGIAYCIEGNLPIPERLQAHAAKNDRYSKVYHLDPVPDYVCDTARKESKERGNHLHKLIGEVYAKAGYTVIKVPFLSVEERAQYILKNME